MKNLAQVSLHPQVFEEEHKQHISEFNSELPIMTAQKIEIDFFLYGKKNDS